MENVINYEDRLAKLAHLFANGYLSSKHKKQYLQLASWKEEELNKLEAESASIANDGIPLIQKLIKKIKN